MYTKAAVALHNYLQTTEFSVYSPPGYVDGEDGSKNIVEGSWREEGTTGLTQVNQVGSNRCIYIYIYIYVLPSTRKGTTWC